MKQFMITLLILLLFLSPSTALSAMDIPRGPVVLTFNGLITQKNKSGKAVFDMEMLKALPQVNIATVTPWTDGVVNFEGPLLRDVLRLVGAKGTHLKAMAINDYFVDIPISDAERFDVILALRMNDKDMNIRSKGPLWVIYPWSQQDTLRSETYYTRSIWQLVSIEVQ